MSTRASEYAATVREQRALSPHLTRLVLDVDPAFASTGVFDEWVGLVVPGQFQVRYYTVRWCGDGELVLDVVLHEVGLVTEWASRGCVGNTVVVTEPKGSFALPDDAAWVMLVGDLTALPAIARITANVELPIRVWAEVADAELRDGQYLHGGDNITWLDTPADGTSRLAEVVESLDWPAGDGYFWMAGESAQMRAIRKHLMRERQLPATAYDVMGYWRSAAQRQPPASVPGEARDEPSRRDPGPIYREGKAQGLSDEEIWAKYDEARS